MGEPSAAIFFGIMIVWGLFEVGMALFRRANATTTAKRDAKTFPLLWGTIGASVGMGVYLGIRCLGRIDAVEPLAAWVGLAMIVLGLLIRGLAILTLRKFFTVDVVVHADHQVVRTGIYRWLRHPSYSGSLLSFVGLGVALESWVSLLVVAIPVTTAFLWRIHIEELALHSGLGAAYADYCKNTARLIPFVY